MLKLHTRFYGARKHFTTTYACEGVGIHTAVATPADMPCITHDVRLREGVCYD